MKHKINQKTERLAATLQGEYLALYQQLCENVQDEAYTKSEINFFIRKTILSMKEAQDKGTEASVFAHKNKKKWHEAYNKTMKSCDLVSYLGLFAIVAFSILMIVTTAFEKGGNPIWMTTACTAASVVLIYLKIKHAKKLPLTWLYQYGDIIIFAIVGLICYYSNIYFIIYICIISNITL